MMQLGLDGTVAVFAQKSEDGTNVWLTIASCITESSRDRLRAIQPLPVRAAATLAEMNYYPTRFPSRISPYSAEHARESRLDLPMASREFDAVQFVDELR